MPEALVPLTISSLTLGRVLDGRLPPVPQIGFAERVAAAATGGFGGIGLSVESYREARAAGWSDAGMLECLDWHGVAITEVEFLREWLEETEEGAAKEAAAAHLVEVFGAHHVNAGVLAPGTPPTVVAERFAGLCQRLAPIPIAFEFMPFGAIATLPQAGALLEGCGPNGGLVLDAFHWAHSHASVQDLGELDPARVLAVQLCDVRKQPGPELLLEARHHRRLPTLEGAAGTVARAVAAVGATPVWSVEVLADWLRGLHPDEAARQCGEAARSVLEELSPGAGNAG